MYRMVILRKLVEWSAVLVTWSECMMHIVFGRQEDVSFWGRLLEMRDGGCNAFHNRIFESLCIQLKGKSIGKEWMSKKQGDNLKEDEDSMNYSRRLAAARLSAWRWWKQGAVSISNNQRWHQVKFQSQTAPTASCSSKSKDENRTKRGQIYVLCKLYLQLCTLPQGISLSWITKGVVHRLKRNENAHQIRSRGVAEITCFVQRFHWEARKHLLEETAVSIRAKGCTSQILSVFSDP